MSPELNSTLIKVLLPAAAIIVALVVSKRRGYSWSKDLGFALPSAKSVTLWLGFWMVWMASSEALIDAFGLVQAQPWPDYPWPVLLIRVLAIGILGPVAEEVIARGTAFNVLRRKRIGPYGAILLIAIVWALLHLRYDPGTIALIAMDGVIFGLARHQSGSLWVPIAMHVSGNIFSIGQSLGLW